MKCECRQQYLGYLQFSKCRSKDIEACQQLLASGDWANPARHEGMVVADAHFNRVKASQHVCTYCKHGRHSCACGVNLFALCYQVPEVAGSAMRSLLHSVWCEHARQYALVAVI